MDHDPSPLEPARLSGFELYRRSRNLGEIEEVVSLGRHRYYVIDARHWSYGTRKLLPVAAVTTVDLASRRAFTDAEPGVMRSSPDFEPFLLGDDRYASRVERYFADRFGSQRSDPQRSASPDGGWSDRDRSDGDRSDGDRSDGDRDDRS